MTCPRCGGEMVDIELHGPNPYFAHLNATDSYRCRNTKPVSELLRRRELVEQLGRRAK